MSVIDDYFKGVDAPKRKELERVCKIVKQIVPEAEEVISYGIPCLDYKGKHLMFFAAFKNHMSVFPGARLTAELKAKLPSYETRKGTVQFTVDKPLPEAIIKEIVRARLAEISKN